MKSDNAGAYSLGGKTPAAAYYILGLVKGQLGKYQQAREAFEKMIKTTSEPDYGNLYMQMTDEVMNVGVLDKTIAIDVYSGYAKAYIVSCYLKEGKVDEGLQEGLKTLQILEKSPRRHPEMIAHLASLNYNIACAYALKGDKANALKYIRESLALNPLLKIEMSKDEDLRILREDKEFQDLIKP